jgi:hypothetical protein
MMLGVPPPIRGQLRNPEVPLFITEGVRKADSAVSHDLCCVGLLGVWNWRRTNNDGGTVALADWEQIALNDRDVYVAFDSDVMSKAEVHAALVRFKALLERRKARVYVVYLPWNGRKVGLDDYLAKGHSVEELLSRHVFSVRCRQTMFILWISCVMRNSFTPMMRRHTHRFP